MNHPCETIQLEVTYAHTWVLQWGSKENPIRSGDTCEGIRMSRAIERSLQAYGDFDGAVVSLGGSNEPVKLDGDVQHLVPLHDVHGMIATLKTGDIIRVADISNWICPMIDGGGDNQALCISLLIRSAL